MTQHHHTSDETTASSTATASQPFVQQVRAEVADLVDRTHEWGDAHTDSALDVLTTRLAAQLAEHPDQIDHLLRALREEPEGSTLHGVLRALAVPWPPLALAAPDRFRSHPAVRATESSMPIAPAAALPMLDALTGLDERLMAHEDLSWLGGRPLALGLTEWPRTAAGAPLTHLFTAHLTTLSPWREIGFPTPGVLQVFHDLVSTGDPAQAQARENGAWLVRFVRDADLPSNLAVTPVLEWPRDVDVADRVAPVPTSPHLVATVPHPLSPGDVTQEERDRHGRVVDLLEWWTRVTNAINAPEREHGEDPFLDPDRAPLPSTTRIGGFPAAPADAQHDAMLAQALPLGPEDSYVLLADVNPAELTDQRWFHGGHLQVWIRSMDLALGRLEKAWCVIRTDA
ncbi:DUF1963 domain-containing protein [Nocardioides yefusunii]|uniref:DUF1963 domain-containing protein n=1 Tax=Nocardioides yefusunii TaxID=2500546 RepID=A0ABW1QX38_9ACTN|nr:DUF1963 domain-containing protein [Nocardioides yefusunii]